jgi:uncharacterized membrane protein
VKELGWNLLLLLFFLSLLLLVLSLFSQSSRTGRLSPTIYSSPLASQFIFIISAKLRRFVIVAFQMQVQIIAMFMPAARFTG